MCLQCGILQLPSALERFSQRASTNKRIPTCGYSWLHVQIATLNLNCAAARIQSARSTNKVLDVDQVVTNKDFKLGELKVSAGKKHHGLVKLRRDLDASDEM